jgi:hypothetical protein
MRNPIIPLILGGILVFHAGEALAKTVAMHNHGADEIKSACTNAGGEFVQDSGGYACSTNCHGGPPGSGQVCVVSCKSDHTCLGEVPGRQGPTVSPINVLRGSTKTGR